MDKKKALIFGLLKEGEYLNGSFLKIYCICPILQKDPKNHWKGATSLLSSII